MKPLKTIAVLALAAALPLGAAQASSRDLLSTAGETAKFTELLEAAEMAGVTDILQGPGPITVFAPTDDAFDKLDPEFIAYLTEPENRDELKALIKKHIVPGKVTAEDLRKADGPLSTLLDTRLRVDGSAGLKVANAKVTVSDILASNGVIHAIDTVLEPDL